MNSQQKQVVMVMRVVQKLLSANITVSILLGARSWVLNRLKLSTTIRGGMLWKEQKKEDVIVLD